MAKPYSSDDNTTQWLLTMGDIKQNKPRRIDLAINNRLMRSKIDTVVDVTAVPEDTNKKLKLLTLAAPREALHGYYPQEVTGKQKATIQGNKEQQTLQYIYICPPSHGRATIRKTSH